VEIFINTDRYIPMSTKLQTALCMWWLSVWWRRLAGKLVFKFQRPPGYLAHTVRNYGRKT